MGDKDISEKALLRYADVFADIVNVLLFDGEQRILPNDLTEVDPHTYYNGKQRQNIQIQDIVKYWKKENIQIACIGFENQTKNFKVTFRLLLIILYRNDYIMTTNRRRKRFSMWRKHCFYCPPYQMIDDLKKFFRFLNRNGSIIWNDFHCRQKKLPACALTQTDSF